MDDNHSKTYVERYIKINGQMLNFVDKFTCLGSILSMHVTINDEVTARLAKTSPALGRLWDRVWNKKGITRQTKIKVYRAVALTAPACL